MTLIGRNGKTKPVDLRKLRKTSNAMIVVEHTKKRVFRNVSFKKIPRDSFPKTYDNRDVHVLGCNLKGELWPIKVNNAQNNRLPADLFMALHSEGEVSTMWGLDMPTTEKIKWGIFIGALIGIVVCLVLITVSLSG